MGAATLSPTPVGATPAFSTSPTWSRAKRRVGLCPLDHPHRSATESFKKSHTEQWVFINHALFLQAAEVDILGLDGQVYKGRMSSRAVRLSETRFPTISPREGKTICQREYLHKCLLLITIQVWLNHQNMSMIYWEEGNTQLQLIMKYEFTKNAY